MVDIIVPFLMESVSRRRHCGESLPDDFIVCPRTGFGYKSARGVVRSSVSRLAINSIIHSVVRMAGSQHGLPPKLCLIAPPPSGRGSNSPRGSSPSADQRNVCVGALGPRRVSTKLEKLLWIRVDSHYAPPWRSILFSACPFATEVS